MASVQPGAYAFSPEIAEEGEAVAAECLQSASAELRREGVLATGRRLRGDPAGRIADLAEQTPGSLVVMCSHARSGISRGVLGSVADGVLRASSRPLLLFRP